MIQQAITDEFKLHAKELADLYHERSHLAKLILEKETRLRELGLILEFTDNLEKNIDCPNLLSLDDEISESEEGFFIDKDEDF